MKMKNYNINGKTFNINSKVADWYKEEYPTDTWAYDEMDKRITFKTVMNRMKKGENIYKIIKVDDSIARERVFEGLTKVTDLPYDYFYYSWLRGPEFAEAELDRFQVWDYKKEKLNTLMKEISELLETL